MKIMQFQVGAPDPTGEMNADVTFAIKNVPSHDLRWVQYRVVFENRQGFPIQCSEGSEDCRLEPDEAFQISTSCILQNHTAGTSRDDIVARVAASLHAREFLRLGEVEAPIQEFGWATLSRTVQSAVLDPTLKIGLLRSRNDDEGHGRVECRVILQNRSQSHLDRVVLKCELLDADEVSIDENEDSISIPSGSTACLEGGTSWVKASRFKNAKIRLSLSVYRPIESVECVGTSSPETVALEHEDPDSNQEFAGQEDLDGEEENCEAEARERDSDDEEMSDIPEVSNASIRNEADNEAECDGLEPRVVEILEAAGAMEHSPAFLENQITEDVLPSLTDSDLAAMGITAIGLRKRILAAIAAPRQTAPIPLPKSTDWTRVLEPLVMNLARFSRAIVDPPWGSKKLEGARSFAPQVTASTRILLAYDDTMFGSGKDGILVSELGVHWRNAFEKPEFIAWRDFRLADAQAKKIEMRPGAFASCAFAGTEAAAVIARLINRAAGAAMVSASFPTPSVAKELKNAIIEMMKVDSEDDFVVLSELEGDAFVQFCSGEEGPQINVPVPDERNPRIERLLGFMQQTGIESERAEAVLNYWGAFKEDQIDDLISFAFQVLHGGQAVPLTGTLSIQRGWQS